MKNLYVIQMGSEHGIPVFYTADDEPPQSTMAQVYPTREAAEEDREIILETWDVSMEEVRIIRIDVPK